MKAKAGDVVKATQALALLKKHSIPGHEAEMEANIQAINKAAATTINAIVLLLDKSTKKDKRGEYVMDQYGRPALQGRQGVMDKIAGIMNETIEVPIHKIPASAIKNAGIPESAIWPPMIDPGR